MKAEHRYVTRKDDEPIPTEIVDQVKSFMKHMENGDLQKLDFMIGLGIFDTGKKNDKGDDVSEMAGVMVGAPPKLMAGLVELAGNLLGPHPQMQRMFLALLIADFAARKGTPPPDSPDIDADALKLGEQLMGHLRTKH